MVSIDTNVAVRLLVNDDPEQTRRAAELFSGHKIFISKTVALETEWILRGVYKLDVKKVNFALTALLSLENVLVEDVSSLFTALDAHAKGMDFADALHLASSSSAESFATFDTAFRARAKKLSLLPPVISP
ncbi:MAG: type II toxin-antitoxin system VapC family toxin [Desulfuromonadaceae bacterium]